MGIKKFSKATKISLWVVTLTYIAVLLVQFTTPTFAQVDSSNNQSQFVVLSADDAYRADAEAYVAAFGGTIDEAVRRLKLQGAIAELDEVLQTQEKGIFAGLWIEHTPRFRVVVQLTNGGQDSITPYISGGPLVGLVEVQNASISLEELRATHNDVIKAVQTTGILAESDIDLQTGIIEVGCVIHI